MKTPIAIILALMVTGAAQAGDFETVAEACGIEVSELREVIERDVERMEANLPPDEALPFVEGGRWDAREVIERAVHFDAKNIRKYGRRAIEAWEEKYGGCLQAYEKMNGWLVNTDWDEFVAEERAKKAEAERL